MEEKKLYTELYTPLQSLNNLRYNYFQGLRNADETLEHLWFDLVENSIKEGESWERDYFELKDKYDQLDGAFDDIQDSSVLEHQAIAIIKEKYVDISAILSSSSFETYCFLIEGFGHINHLTQEEYCLLKEVLL